MIHDYKAQAAGETSYQFNDFEMAPDYDEKPQKIDRDNVYRLECPYCHELSMFLWRDAAGYDNLRPCTCTQSTQNSK